jgi:hypothetical protein
VAGGATIDHRRSDVRGVSCGDEVLDGASLYRSKTVQGDQVEGVEEIPGEFLLV